MSHRVAIVRYGDYSPEMLERKIRRAVILTGFIIKSVKKRKVLLKPNMLGAYPPEMGVTTHPEFVAAAGRVFAKAGAHVMVGDSPNGVHMPERTWDVTGIGEVCKRDGLEAAPFEKAGSELVDGQRISRAVRAADFVVNLPKFKTHGLTYMTLAVKNLFGCVNGMQKSTIHRDHPDPRDFSREVLKIARAVSPSLSIVDGIVAMEGDGPSGGTLKQLGTIVAGMDMHRVDRVCCDIAGISQGDLDTLSLAKEQGLWSDGDEIEMMGDPLEKPGFVLPSTFMKGSRDWAISRLAMKIIFGSVKAQPRIRSSVCKRCGLCVDACPVDAIEHRGEKLPPKIKEELCIQCFCCHEVCPHKAIATRSSISMKAWRWLDRRRIARLSRKEGPCEKRS